MGASILKTEKGTCILCGRKGQTEEHHLFGGPNRRLSEEDGLKVYLCPRCHHDRIHGLDRQAIEFLKQEGQRAYMETYSKGTRDFVVRYGKNYLDEWV